MPPLPPVTPIRLSLAVAGAIAAAQISDDDFEKHDGPGSTIVHRLREDSVSMRNLEPVLKQIVDEIVSVLELA